MATYNSVTFTVLTDGENALDLWQREERVVITPIPGASVDDVQWLGLGNQMLTVSALIESAADLATLEGSRGITKRSLTGVNGSTYTNTMLLRVQGAKKSMGLFWTASLVFCREA